MKVKFSRCTSSNLANVPKVDGQLIYTKDTGEAYIDVGTTRHKISDLVEVPDIQNVVSPIVSKIYYDETTEKLYKAEINGNNIIWHNLSNVEQVPQIFSWTRNLSKTAIDISATADIDLWTEVVEASKSSDCLVVCTNVNSVNTDLILFDIPKNSLVMSNSQINVPTNMFQVTDYKTNSGYTSVYRTIYRAELKYTNDVMTSIRWTPAGSIMSEYDIISANANYGTPYVPQYASSPVNKKYVDDKCVPYQPFPAGITTNSTTQVFLNSIKALNLPSGSTYLGGVTLTDMPFAGNAEVEVYVYPNNVIYCELRSSNVSPYRWECNSHTYRGWEAINHPNASLVSYDNTTSGLVASTTQGAIDELAGSIGDINTILDDINGEVV